MTRVGLVGALRWKTVKVTQKDQELHKSHELSVNFNTNVIHKTKGHTLYLKKS
jgi:hypothetical protein